MYAILKAFAAGLVIAFAAGGSAMAQQSTWLQIEARPQLGQAMDAARGYAEGIENVNGFRLGATGWYAIVLGPFANRAEARSVRQTLRNRSAIPSDSFVTDNSGFGTRFWPDETVQADPTPAPAPTPDPAPPPAPAVIPEAVRADDTPAATTAEAEPEVPLPPEEDLDEARASEAALTEAERKLLQTALQWDGHYDAAIDGDFGRGTRAAMQSWQEAQGVEPTGVLTTRQRAALLGAYNALLEGLGLETVTDETAGIQITLPTAVVAFDRYVPPFAHYEPREDGARHKVILISQRGTQATLFGLYDIMQTLEIVPETGPRERRDQGFTLVGEGTDFTSHTEAFLRDGTVKGFTLVWPAGDDRRRRRVIDEMRASFTALAGKVLDDLDATPGEEQSIDLLAGLEIKRPEWSRSGFYVSGDGAVLTSAQTVASCGRVTLDDEVPASIATLDEASGLALLRPDAPLAPRDHARLRGGAPLLGSDVILAGFAFGGALGAPSLAYGKIAGMRGLNGDDSVRRLDLAARPDDAGGAVMDEAGGVLGLLLPRDDGADRSLPDTVSFAVDSDAIAAFLDQAGASATPAQEATRLRPAEMTRLATDITVLVNCWK